MKINIKKIIAFCFLFGVFGLMAWFIPELILLLFGLLAFVLIFIWSVETLFG
jgi:hypothetical protein